MKEQLKLGSTAHLKPHEYTRQMAAQKGVPIGRLAMNLRTLLIVANKQGQSRK